MIWNLEHQEWTIVACLIYLAVLVALMGYTYIVRRSSILEPVSMLLFFTTLYAIPLPLRYIFTSEIEGNVSPMLPQFAPYLPISLILTSISMIVFVIAYYSNFTKDAAAWIPKLPSIGSQGASFGIFFLIGLSAVLIYMLTSPLGGLSSFLLLGYGSSEEAFSKGYLAVGFPWLVVAMLALFEKFSFTRHIGDIIAGLTLLTITSGIFLITGNRGLIMYSGIAMLIMVHHRLHKISSKSIFLIVISGFFALNVVGILRKAEYQDINEFIETTTSTEQAESNSFKENIFYTLTIGEFVVPFETLPQIIRTIGITEQPWLGQSIINATQQLIPSFAFPDRPLPLGNWYMSRFYGGGFGSNEGRAFFYLSEGYLNFGFLGMFMVAAAWGLLWGALQKWMEREKQQFGTILIYALLVAYLFRCIRGDFATLLVGTTQQSLAAIFIIFIIARMFPKKHKTNDLLELQQRLATQQKH